MELKKDGLYFAYLRKSREDRDAEQHGEGETLERHRKILCDMASRYGITVATWYKEVVSGETIAARPEMLKMLEAIEDMRPDGVLVVELERLARGDTRDQGLIMETFKYSGTRIITPMKIYNPNDEFDEEYAEFGLFMSRREYKTINRRLQRGRKSSISEGKWIGNKSPYGYERVKIPNDKGFTLQAIPEEAAVVRLIYNMYVHGTPESGNIPVGTATIGHILDDMGVKPPNGSYWPACTVRRIVENPVYIGKLQHGYRPQQKRTVNGKITTSRPISKEYQIYNGLHTPIIDQELFDLAGQKRKESYRKPFFHGIKNPLAGLIYCTECGKSMYRRPASPTCRDDMIMCATRGCKTSASYYYLIEDRLLQALNQWLDEYRVQIEDTSLELNRAQLERYKTQLASAQEAETTAQKQLEKAMDLVEKEVYSIEMFQQRATALNEKIALARREAKELSEKIRKLEKLTADKQTVIARWEHVLEEYPNVDSPVVKNTMLKEIIERVEYSKPYKGNRKSGGMDKFTLKIFPRL